MILKWLECGEHSFVLFNMYYILIMWLLSTNHLVLRVALFLFSQSRTEYLTQGTNVINEYERISWIKTYRFFFKNDRAKVFQKLSMKSKRRKNLKTVSWKLKKRKKFLRRNKQKIWKNFEKQSTVSIKFHNKCKSSFFSYSGVEFLCWKTGIFNIILHWWKILILFYFSLFWLFLDFLRILLFFEINNFPQKLLCIVYYSIHQT